MKQEHPGREVQESPAFRRGEDVIWHRATVAGVLTLAGLAALLGLYWALAALYLLLAVHRTADGLVYGALAVFAGVLASVLTAIARAVVGDIDRQDADR